MLPILLMFLGDMLTLRMVPPNLSFLIVKLRKNPLQLIHPCGRRMFLLAMMMMMMMMI